MADLLSIHIVVEFRIVVHVIGQPVHQALKLPEQIQVQVFALILAQLLHHLIQPVLRIENGRLIHIIPEAFHSLIQQELVLIAEPVSGLLVEHIRKQSLPRPHCRHKRSSILLLAEIALFKSFLINGIPLFLLHARVNDGHQMNILLLHLLVELLKLRKCLVIQRKILISLHVVNIQIHTVQRNPQLAVFVHHLPHLVLIHIAPPALAVTKRPHGNHKTAPDQMTELLYNILHILSGNHIQIQIPVRRCDLQL